MNDIFNKRLTVSDNVIASPVGDETVILDLKTSAYLGFNPVGTRIWELLKEGLAPADICDRMADDFDVSHEVLEVDVRHFLGELKAREIVVEPDRSDN